MSEDTPQPRQAILTTAFCIYAVSTLISMAVMSVGTAIFLAAMLWVFGGPKPLLNRIREGLRSSVWERRYLAVAIALAVSCVGSLVSAKIWPLAYGGHASDVHLLKDSLKLWYLFWPLVLAAGLGTLSPERREKILTSWIAACALLGIIAVIQHFTGWPRRQVIPPEIPPFRYHATLFLGHHLSVASILIFPFFASLDLFRRRRKWIYAAAAVLGALALFLTYSRILWLALPATILIWALMNLPRRATAALCAFLAAVVLMASQVSLVRDRFRADIFQAGLGPRTDLWKANLEFLKERPLLGVGWKHNQELSGYYLLQKYPGQSVFSGHAHNNLLDMLGGTGVLGALSWLAWSIVVLAMAWVAWRRKLGSAEVFASGLFCAWIAFHINGLTQVNFWEAKVTHQVMWMVAWSLLWLSPRSAQARSS